MALGACLPASPQAVPLRGAKAEMRNSKR